MKVLSYILIVIIVILGVTFATLNSEIVSFNYYVGHKSMPLSMLLVSVFAIGCLLGIAVGLWMLIKARFRYYKLKQQLRIAEKEIDNLRAIPLQDKH